MRKFAVHGFSAVKNEDFAPTLDCRSGALCTSPFTPKPQSSDNTGVHHNSLPAAVFFPKESRARKTEHTWYAS